MNKNLVLSKYDLIAFLTQNKRHMQQNFGFKEIFLYGSYAKGRMVAESDIDLLVDIEKSKKSYRNLLLAKQFLTSSLLKPIDLVFIDSINPIIAEAIRKELIKIE